MSFETKDDPVLILATSEYLFFGIHGATSPTYGDGTNGWTRRYSSRKTGYPVWPSDYLRCAWSAPGMGLPDIWARPPTPRTINAKRLPWLQATFSKDLVVCGGDPLSKVAETFARFGGELYVPITRMGSKAWARLDKVRAACLKAGHVVDDLQVEAAAARRREPTGMTSASLIALLQRADPSGTMVVSISATSLRVNQADGWQTVADAHLRPSPPLPGSNAARQLARGARLPT